MGGRRGSPLTPGARRSGRRSLRKRLYGWHAWAGFQLALLTFVVLATGTFAVVGDELDWLLDPQRRVAPSPAPPAWDAMFATARATRPEQGIVELRLGELASMAAQVRTQRPDGRPHRIFVDPATGALRGEGHWLSAQRLLRDLHRYLFLLWGGIGLPVVTIAAGVLAVQLVTGLLLVRRWRDGLTTLRLDRGPRVAVGDLHRAGGLWFAWFVLLMVVTSFWYLTEWSMLRTGHNPEAQRVSPGFRDATPAAVQLRPPSAYLAAVHAVWPELEPVSILYPGSAEHPLTVTGRGGDALVRDRAARVFLDPHTAEVLRVQRPGELAPLEYVTELADPWHFGDVGGLWTKGLWFLGGLVLTGLAGTGVWLTWRRTRTLAGGWHAATALVLVATAAAGTAYVRHYLNEEEAEPGRLATHFTHAGVPGEVRIVDGASATIRVRLGGSGATLPALPRVRELWLEAPDGTRHALRRRTGPWPYRAEVVLPDPPPRELTLHLRGPDERITEVGLALSAGMLATAP